MNGRMGAVLCAVVALACGGLESDARVEPAAQGIAVAIFPLVASVTPGGSVAFDAEITGTANTSVLWSVEEGDAGGSVTTSGLYSAPAAEGSYHVLVASAADVTRTARATVTVAVTPPPPPPPPPSATPFCDRLVRDTVTHSQGSLAKPGYLQSVVDPVFGTTITRITGDVGTPIPNVTAPSGVSGSWGNEFIPVYTKRPMWSTPDTRGRTLLMIDETNQGGKCPLFLDGDTYQPLYLRGALNSTTHDVLDRRWHPVLPDTLVEVDNDNGDIRFWNVRTDTITLVYAAGLTGASDGFVGIGPGEGMISKDGRWVVIAVTSPSAYFFVVDLTACMPTPSANCATKKTATVTAGALGIGELDWASISPLGTYIVAMENNPDVARVLRWDQTTGAVDTTPAATFSSGHMDMGVGHDGLEYAQNGVGQMWKLSVGGTATSVWNNRAGSYHTNSRPGGTGSLDGWWLATTYNSTGTAANELIAYGTNGEFYRLAHHRRSSGSPHGVMSPDGRRVIFGSDWGVAGGPIQAYVVDVRPLCP